MVKDATIIIRVSTEDKEELEAASRSRGKSLTTYLLEAAKKQARADRKRNTSSVAFRGVPTFFRALSAEARRGGSNGYSVAGYELARHLEDLVPYDIDNTDEWLTLVNDLQEMILAEDDDGAWQWFERYLPKCIGLIPKRRKEQFLTGVWRYIDEHGMV